MKRSDIPNLVTLLRFFLVPPVVWSLAYGHFGSALIIFAVAGFSDALDGFLAKRYGWSSMWGARLDPLADKALLVSAYVTLGWLQLIPLWVVVLVMARDVIILAGAITYYFRIEPVEADPTFLSKLNTLVQILFVLAVVLNAGYAVLPESWIVDLVYYVAATTVLSGLDYVWTWGWRAWRRGRPGRGAV